MMRALSRLRTALFITLQYVLPQIALTRVLGRLGEVKTGWVKRLLIRFWIRTFAADLTEARRKDIDEYQSLTDFFTRELDDDTRPLAQAPAVLCPSDGVVSQCGPIDGDQLFQAKGFRYSLQELLGDDFETESFRDGCFATIYLAPGDYHRVHTPLNAALAVHRHIPGQLFSVNQATAAAVPKLFARNERRVFGFGPHGSEAALVMVGALNVGSITTPWQGLLPAGSLDNETALECPTTRMHRGDLLGWFNLGSTVILILPESYRLREDLSPGQRVQMGEAIALPNLD